MHTFIVLMILTVLSFTQSTMGRFTKLLGLPHRKSAIALVECNHCVKLFHQAKCFLIKVVWGKYLKTSLSVDRVHDHNENKMWNVWIRIAEKCNRSREVHFDGSQSVLLSKGT